MDNYFIAILDEDKLNLSPCCCRGPDADLDGLWDEDGGGGGGEGAADGGGGRRWRVRRRRNGCCSGSMAFFFSNEYLLTRAVEWNLRFVLRAFMFRNNKLGTCFFM